ncbi:MAG: vWA domain-containing protein [Panacagrimonas sp.]
MISLRQFLRRRGLILLLLSAALVLPIYLAPRVWLPGPTFRYLFVLDVTQSMNVLDVSDGTRSRARIEASREALTAALRQLPCGSIVSIALFAEIDALPLFEPLEICDHFPAIEKVVAGIHWRMAWSGNSNIDSGISSAMREAAKRDLDLVFVTDGDQKPVRAVRVSLMKTQRGKARGWLVGVGGDQPRPVPRLDPNDKVIGYWEPGEARRQGFNPNAVAGGSTGYDDARDFDPEEHLSSLHEVDLKDLARAAGLEYVRLTGSPSLVSAVSDTSLARIADAPRDLRFVFGLAGALLLLAGWVWREHGA